MRLKADHCCDVLVVGAGIAGLSAALEAARRGCSVTLTSSTHIFSGSSFYPGTWGLGLIGPADERDQEDLMGSIRDVGCGMADETMVRTFVKGIAPAIGRLREMGVKLRRAAKDGEREYIPCFDHKHRDWNGLEGDSVRSVFSQRMSAMGVRLRPFCELLELVREGDAVCGAVFREGERLVYIACRTLVLATGGYGGIFQYHLCTSDISGMGQSLALRAGCTLTNMEFMQMMPGYLTPAPKTVFNEKTFRFTSIVDASGKRLFPPGADADDLLAVRSTHGPFTCRLKSREVDFALYRAFCEDERGVTVTYSEQMKREPPEFVKTYFDWLWKDKHVSMDEPVQIGIFAHAANGGVRIKEDASTGVPGLFACGEVTGGMHGADRIGGLSTANGLVFGGIAGRSAARACAQLPPGPGEYVFSPWEIGGRAELLRALRAAMFRSAMIIRTDSGLREARDLVLAQLGKMERKPAQNARDIAESRRIEGQYITELCVIDAALARRESRGSHYRADYPETDPEDISRIDLRLSDGLCGLLQMR